MNNKLNIRKSTIYVATMGLLISLLVIMSVLTSRFRTDTIKFSLTFIPVIMAAKLFGLQGAVIVASLGDIISYLANPIGSWFPPITFTEALAGLVFGLFLSKSEKFIFVLIPVLITQCILSAFVTPIWLCLLYGSPYTGFLVARIPQIAVMTAIELIVIPAMLNLLNKLKLDNILLPD